jgi:predicted phosphodiesterase
VKTAAILSLLLLATPAWAQKDPGSGEENKNQLHSDVPAYDVNVVLARPTTDSVVANVFVQKALNVQIRYGADDKLAQSTGTKKMLAGDTHEFLLENLPQDSTVNYGLYDAGSGQAIESPYSKGAFQTARPHGQGFTFTIQADSHLDGDTIPSLYELTLQNVANAKPDFHIDLGDTFMADKVSSLELAEKQYLAQRFYFGQVCHSVPLFLVTGNHDGISGKKTSKKNTGDLTAWSLQQRARYFPSPVADAFYQSEPDAGQLHFAWNWGDALFIVLDPYSNSGPTKSGQEPWNMTLGKAQYEWLAGVLRDSKASFKFVFVHQLPGGLGRGARGGVEAASLYEWGGHNEAGEWQFESFRPGWEQPVHSLLRETRVSAVFHGHDHFFAYQQLDGITYQLVPQPAHRNHRKHHAEEYGYESGTFVPNSGHIQVDVNSSKAVVKYIRSANEQLKKAIFQNGDVAFEYEIDALRLNLNEQREE